MLYVMYTISLIAAIFSILLLSRWLNRRLKALESNYELNKAQRDLKAEELRNLEGENAGLVENVDSIVELYEITKELTKYQNLEEVLRVFQQRLKEKVALDDCRFVESENELANFPDYEIFDLKIENELKEYLAIKGLRPEDKDKFHILLNQFILILKRVNLYTKIEKLSITDSLTGLYLRRFFQERLNEEIIRSKKFNLKFVLLMLDLDNFKACNDRYGHLVGDVVLSTVARIIKENVRSIDIVARYGGEEFSVILPEIGREEGEYVGWRFCKAIENARIQAYDESLQITVSIGASLFPQDATEPEELIDKADQALYYAKQAGKNRICFWEKGMMQGIEAKRKNLI